MEEPELIQRERKMHVWMSDKNPAKLFAAVAKAQGAMEPAKKDSVNPFFNNSTYASLHEIIAAGRGPLSENGIAVLQLEYREGANFGITTIIGHESGEWIAGECDLNASENIQKLGSAGTYLCRYGRRDALGIPVADPLDDDGNKSAGNGDILPPPTAPDPLFSLPPAKVEKKPKRGDAERAAMAEPTAWDGKKPTEKQKKAEYEGFLAYIHKMSPGTYSMTEKVEQVRAKHSQGWFTHAQCCELAIRLYAKHGDKKTAQTILANAVHNNEFDTDKTSMLDAVIEASVGEFKVARLNRGAILEKLGECSTLVEWDAIVIPLVGQCSAEEATWLAEERQNAEKRLNG